VRTRVGPIVDGLGPAYRPSTLSTATGHLILQLHLHDGAPLAIIVFFFSPPPLPVWLLPLFAFQFGALVAISWLAVRQATRPLAQLARAADALGRDARGVSLAEGGPL